VDRDAHIAYRLLRDVGVDPEEMVYRRDPVKWKYPYAFDVPLDTWYEPIVANAFYDRAFYDRAGDCLLGDVYASTTFGQSKRSLASDSAPSWRWTCAQASVSSAF
jgi:ring-1,2-phenylacetyl-CoA epoxidase subunit PaaA